MTELRRIALVAIVSFLVLGGVASQARADILFMDLNVNDLELQAAQQAARARHEKLVVIPEIPAGIRAQAARLSARYRTLERQIAQASEPERSTLEAEQNKVDEKRAALLDRKAYQVTIGKIDHLLSAYDREGKRFDSVVLSSHHVSYFYSDYGSQFEDEAFKAVFKRHPKQRKAIASLFLWGCYNGAPATVLEWKDAFPGAHVVAGWDGLAPSEGRAIDMTLLRDLLVKEKEVSDVADARELLRKYDEIPGIGVSSGAFATFCSKDLWVGHGHVVDLKTTPCHPAKVKKALDDVNREYYGYLLAKKGFEDVPPDVHHSKLRDAYSEFRAVEDCSEDTKEMKRIVPFILDLIFFKTIARNFQLYYAGDLAKANLLLKRFGVTIPDLSNPKLTRSAILAVLNKMETAQFSMASPDNEFLGALSKKMTEILDYFQGIDATWLDPVSSRTYLHAPNLR